MHRKITPLHNFWHRKVEGQIRHTMGRHPEWFKQVTDKFHFVNSLAKRIVGEIVAVVPDGNNTGLDDLNCPTLLDVSSAAIVPKQEGELLLNVTSPFRLKWYDAKKKLPNLNKKNLPYLVTYKSNKGKSVVVVAIWAGENKGWVFLGKNYKSCLSKNVKAWTMFPKPWRKI